LSFPTAMPRGARFSLSASSLTNSSLQIQWWDY
jgi:hypothetical protein